MNSANIGRTRTVAAARRRRGGLRSGASLGMPARNYHSVRVATSIRIGFDVRQLSRRSRLPFVMSRQPTWHSLLVLFGVPDGTFLAWRDRVARLRAAFIVPNLENQGASGNPRERVGNGKHASVQRRWFLTVGAAILTGCLSPTLPMPPPSKPDIEGPDERGVVVLSGHVLPESHVYADNENTGLSYGQIADAVTGAYRFPILASVGDGISMFYRLNGDSSTTLRFVIRASTSSLGAAGAGGAPVQAGTAGTSGVSGALDSGDRGGAPSTPAASSWAGAGNLSGATQ